MSARVCAICRALLGKTHLQGCTVGKEGSIVIDAQCIDTKRESAILWVMLRLHELQCAGIIAPDPTQPAPLHMTPMGVAYAMEYFRTNTPPSRESIEATCDWLFATHIPTPPDTAWKLKTLVLAWRAS